MWCILYIHMALVRNSFLYLLLFVFAISPAYAANGVPRIVAYQGRLLNSSGALVGGTSGTNYCFRFSLYDAVSSGTKVWPSGTPSTMTVNVKNGLYSAGVGDTDAGGDTLDYNFEDSDTVYLNVQVAPSVSDSCAAVSSFESLAPRQRLTSAAYAINAKNVRGVTVTSSTLAFTGSSPTITATGTSTIAFTRLSVSATTTLNGIAYGWPSADGSSGQVLQTNGSGTLSWATPASGASIGGAVTSGTAGSLLYVSSTAIMGQNNSNLFWDTANLRLGIGTNTPSSTLHVAGNLTVPATTGSTNGVILSGANRFIHTYGTSSIYMGINSGNFTNTGYDNIGYGSSTLNALTTGYQNTVMGSGALRVNTTGYENAAFGYDVLKANTTGYQNTGIGSLALRNNTTGAQNTSVGRGALVSNTTGSNNTGIGNASLFVNSTGSNNTGVGDNTLTSNTGSSNTAVGASVLTSNNSGASNTGVGLYSLLFNTTGSYNTASGQEALRSNTTASNNVALGYQSSYSNATGTPNTAVGYQALYSNVASNNTAMGYQALYTNTTGGTNSAFGTSALFGNTTGASNSAVGKSSLTSNTTGSSNSAVGLQALFSNTTGDSNSAMGRDALFSNTTGIQNSAMGQEVLYNNTTASNNTASGYRSLYSNTTGASNSAVGRDALYSNTTAANNTALGYQAGYSNATGTPNTAVGYQALYANVASNNTAVGYQALKTNTTGNLNSAFGDSALYSNTTGNRNTASGYNALVNNSTGGYNTASGYSALGSNTTGSYNTALGQNALYSNGSGNNNIAFGYEAARYQKDGSTALATVTNSVYLGYGTRGWSDSDSNSIVIGASAIGAGANTAVLGNDSITSTLLKGNLFVNALATNSTTTPTGCVGCLVIASSTAPSAMTSNAVALFAVDASGSHELRVMDEAGNTTTLSPHNFSQFTPDPDAILPWSYASENKKKDLSINVDMYGLAQSVEALTGKQLIYAKYMKTGEALDRTEELAKAVAEIEKARGEEKVVSFGAVSSAVAGIEMKDEETGEVYCTRVSRGMLTTRSGACTVKVVAESAPSAAAVAESAIPATAAEIATPSSATPATETTAVEASPAAAAAETAVETAVSSEKEEKENKKDDSAVVAESAPAEDTAVSSAIAPVVEEPAPALVDAESALAANSLRLLSGKPFGNGIGGWLYGFAPVRATIDFFNGFGRYARNGFVVHPAL